ncbi:MAG: hypothetical protein DRI48_05795 [Chloroflexi bacterium]|nr:MAG: hypothetical protein DRI48_05795 [Chloroflexota bacterium]
MKMELANKDWLYPDLIKACSGPGCPLCRLSLAFGRDYLDSTMYERVNDPGVRRALRDARGYCNTHAWMLTEGRGVVLGSAIILRDVLNTVLEVTDVVPRGQDTRQQAQHLLRRLRPTAECPACAHCRAMEDTAIQTLLKYLDDARLAEALAETSGLCLAHFSRALELVEEFDQLQRLLHFQRQALQKLRDELSELIRKQDYRFIDERRGQEGDSWLRATGIVSGERHAG